MRPRGQQYAEEDELGPLGDVCVCQREERPCLLHVSGDFLGGWPSKGMSTFFSPGKNNSASMKNSGFHTHTGTCGSQGDTGSVICSRRL